MYIKAQGWGFPGASRNPQSSCYTRKVVLVYRWGGGVGWGGCNNVMWSALDDVESWKMLLGWKMLLRCKFRCCLQKEGWGGVIMSCEVRWMMLNPGRCCLVGRCCYVANFVVVYRRRGGGGCNNVMWSALDDVESWKMLLGWKMLLRCKFRCCLQKGGWGGVGGV